MSCPQCTPWVPVTESLPDDEITVLIHTEDEDVTIGSHYNTVWYDHDGVPIFNASVTHWMDLPEGPTV